MFKNGFFILVMLLVRSQSLNVKKKKKNRHVNIILATAPYQRTHKQTLPSVQLTLTLPINFKPTDLTFVVSWQLNTTDPRNMTPADSSTEPCRIMWSVSKWIWKSDECTNCIGFGIIFIMLINLRAEKRKGRKKEK
jgi:hypothetical protein